MKLDDYREEIDRIDEQIIELFGRRMEVARRIGEYKKENGLNILDSAREELQRILVLRWLRILRRNYILAV